MLVIKDGPQIEHVIKCVFITCMGQAKADVMIKHNSRQIWLKQAEKG